MEFDDEIREFLIESNENLANLDREIVQLEQNPEDAELISGAFRTIHTIKGTCGFFGYSILGSVAHVTENLLSQVREGQRPLTPELISLVLESVDAIKRLLANIEETAEEGEDTTGPLRARLEQAHRNVGQGQAAQAASVETALPPVGPHSEPAREAAWATAPAVDNTPDTLQAEDAGAVVPAKTPIAHPALQAAAVSETSAVVTQQTQREASVEAGKEAGKDALLADSTIRVDVALLNRLMNLVGELVLARNQLLQDTSSHNPALQQTSQRLNLITSELQEGVMKTRMQPIGVVWNKLPRVVRDLAAQCGKRIQIEMDGAGTELDKTIIEAIKDPLTHIVRNACDHGIEMPEVRLSKNKKAEGLLVLRAYHEGGVVNIEISDDGAGINAERVKTKAVEKGLLRIEQVAQMSERDALHLIFLPGFSTAAAITSISGRGVGMDVVKTNIEKIGGSVEVQNRSESGTVIRIKIPLTLAIIPGLVVTLGKEAGRWAHPGIALPAAAAPEDSVPARRRSAAQRKAVGRDEDRFIIPQANLLELVRLEPADQKERIENVHGTPVFHHRGKLLPLVYLRRVLGRKERVTVDEDVNIIVVQAENRQLGLVVDRICDTQEIVVKPLGRQLNGLACYVGATIMGDGRPALILDVAGLARLAGLGAQSRQAGSPLLRDQDGAGVEQAQMLLLFRAGSYQRLAVPLAQVDRLEEIPLAQFERAAGRPVLYYRGEILPLIRAGELLGDAHTSSTSLSEDKVQVIVFSHANGRLGLIVDQVLDIVHERTEARRNTKALGLLGSAVIAGRITDLVDLEALAAMAGLFHSCEPTYAFGQQPPASDLMRDLEAACR